jgi:4-amino-4-deoxy-L-arabinose transferase-like glycosyltransferase
MLDTAVAARVRRRGGMPTWLRRLGHLGASDRGLALAIGLTALALALYHLGSPSLWMDEALSVEHARQPLDILWASFTSGYSAYMFLYFLILDGWLHLTGWLGLAPTEFIIRFPSAVFGALTAVVVFLLGRRFISRGAGVAAACLYLLNPWQLTYSQDARSYSLLLLFSALAWYTLLVALGTERRQQRWWVWWVLYVLTSTIATYAHILYALVLFAQFVAFACLWSLPSPWRARMRAQWAPLLLSLASIGILVAPLAWVSRSGAWHTEWVRVPTLGDALQRVSQKFLGGSGRLTVAVLALAGLCALLLVAWAWRRGFSGVLKQARQGIAAMRQRVAAVWPGAVACFCWAIVPLVIAWAASEQGTAHLFTGRYLVAIVPALCLVFGIALVALPSRLAQALVLVGALGVTALTLPQYYGHAQIEDWRTPTRWIEQQYLRGDGLVSYNNWQGCEVAIEAYLHGDGSAAHYTPDTPGVMHWAGIRDGNPFGGADAALDVQALARFGASHPRIFFIAGRLTGAADQARVQAVIQWLDAHYHYVDQVSSNVVTIRLYTTEPAAALTAAGG